MSADRDTERGVRGDEVRDARTGRAQEAQRRGALAWRGSGAWAAVVIAVVALIAIVWIVAAAFADDAVLVVPPPNAQLQLSEGDAVRVTGTVADAGEDLEGEAFAELGDESYIDARRVEEIEEQDIEASEVGAGDIVGDDGLQGERVTVTGEVLETDVADGAFTLELAD